MARFTHFSKHALIRISQRTKLTYFDIAEILDYGLAINIGEEPVLDRKHWLFYSFADESYFIAIQDLLTGLVITVLPKQYHENICWKIHSQQLSQARALISKGKVSRNIKNLAPSVIYLKVRYIGEKGYCKTKSTPCASIVVASPEFRNQTRGRPVSDQWPAIQKSSKSPSFRR